MTFIAALLVVICFNHIKAQRSITCNGENTDCRGFNISGTDDPQIVECITEITDDVCRDFIFNCGAGDCDLICRTDLASNLCLNLEFNCYPGY